MSSQRIRAIGIACLAGALLAALIAFGVIPLWPYDTDASYQSYVDGRAVGGVRAGASLVSQNNSAVSIFIVPLVVVGVSLLLKSRIDSEARSAASSKWSAAAIAGGAIALVAYGGFFAQFVDQGDLWLGNPLVVMWLSPALMFVVRILLALPSGSGPQTPDSTRQGLLATLALVALMTVLILALMIFGAIDGFIPLGVAIGVSVLMVGMTLVLAVVILRRSRQS